MTKNRSEANLLALTALGIVYGDIGTSPLYAFRECFYGTHATNPTSENILGILSLIFWSLVLVICIKYLFIVLKADHYGEGGVLALMQSALNHAPKSTFTKSFILIIGLFGAALLYGDGVLTPAISVLSAVEGLELIAPNLEHWVIPITIGILIGLFAFQKFGTAKVGLFFGPIMLIWFAVLAILGVIQIVKSPTGLSAINPMYYAIHFLKTEGSKSLFVLGAVFLVVTGGEALYADMGHLGKTPIRKTWFIIVLPALLLNYFGQGALLLHDSQALENPFYHLVRGWALYLLILLSTIATIIASQAIITGTFSLTYQAIQLHYLPRLRVIHTSYKERGQVYLPQINYLLLVLVIIVVLLFRSSANLAIAYGIAITLTMLITDALLYFVMRYRWKWSFIGSTLLLLLFLMVDVSFFAANSLKIIQGGWFPLIIATLLFTIFWTWTKGRTHFLKQLSIYQKPLTTFVRQFEFKKYLVANSTAVYINYETHTPPALLHNLKHNKVIHQKVIFLEIAFSTLPKVTPSDRVEIKDMGKGFYQVRMKYGYMENVNMLEMLQLWTLYPELKDEQLDQLSFFISREHLFNQQARGWYRIKNSVFMALQQTNQSVSKYFNMPLERTIEIVGQLELDHEINKE